MSVVVPCLRHEHGFSYVEVLVATALLAVGLVPALEALQQGVAGGEIHATLTSDHYHLTAKMEEALAQPFAALEGCGAPGCEDQIGSEGLVSFAACWALRQI